MMEKNKDLQALDHQSIISAKLFPIYPLIGQMIVVISDLCLKKHLYVIVSDFQKNPPFFLVKLITSEIIRGFINISFLISVL